MTLPRLLELMRTSFMQCMADLVQREKVLLINRFQGGETTLLNSYTEQEAATEKAKQELKAKRTASNLKGRKSSMPLGTPSGTPNGSVKR